MADLFERWIARRESAHTQRSYREAVMAFVRFLGLHWPSDAPRLLTVIVANVQALRDSMVAGGAAPKTIIHRISALSGLYKYMREAAAELRLPITVPNPAHSEFIARENADPVEETKALTVPLARRLQSLPVGDSLLAYRDRAIIDFYLYTGARIETGCRLKVGDFHWDGADPKVRINEKGSRRRTIGIHIRAATSIQSYIVEGGLSHGFLFRARLNSRSRKLASLGMSTKTMYNL